MTEITSVTKILKSGEKVYWTAKVGNTYYCDRIEYHQPTGDGDAHYCDIYHGDTLIQRLFRPDYINFAYPEVTP